GCANVLSLGVVVTAGSQAGRCRLVCQLRMERLWSPVITAGGNRAQIVSTRKRLKQAKTVATGCDRLPRAAHGKEEVAAATGCVVLADTRLDYTPTTGSAGW